MKAAVLETEHRLAIREVDPPRIRAADEVLIRVRTVGVCGSEVHAFEGTHPYRKAPVILGHEMAGDVVAVGEAVRAFRVSDRVVVDPQWICGVCRHCRAGNANLCPSKQVLGTRSWPGAFGELIVAPENATFALPPTLSYAEGSLIEPLTIAVHVVRRAGLKAGESVAILGSGSVGALIAGVASALEAGPIITADIRQHCLDVARRRLGATHSILLPDASFPATIQTLTNGEGVHTVFVCADDAKLVNLALEIAGRRGRVVLVALITSEPLGLQAFDLISKEISLIGSLMANHDDVRTALELASSRRVDVAAILTHRLPIEKAQRGMEMAATKDDGAIKVVLEFGA